MTSKKLAAQPLRRRYYKRPLFWVISVAVCLILITALAFRLSPWPGALVIRTVFDRNAHQTLQAMQAKLPDYPVKLVSNQHYRRGDKDALLDVYIPNSVVRTTVALPTVIWTHGGAWLSGDKTNAGPYFERLANQGFVVISLNYSLAPEKAYPAALSQLNAAYAYIQENAGRFHVNAQKIVLAGDSAGAQLSSQMAAILTNPTYAQEVGIKPSLAPSQLSGVVLYCGIYKMEGLTEPDATLPKIVSWGNDVTVWAYTGTRDKSSLLIRQMSAYYHVTKSFPVTFISGGNSDPLTNAQSVPFANKLQSLGVPVTTLFYPQNHTPGLQHEYQFTFNGDGEKAFSDMTQFLKKQTE